MKSKYGNKIAAFVSIHAYSQFWMSPCGYQKAHSVDYNDHMRVMKTSIDALASLYGTSFKHGPISEVKRLIPSIAFNSGFTIGNLCGIRIKC